MATTPEKKLSEFELKMAQRRAATDTSTLSIGSTTTTSPSPSKVSELAQRFNKAPVPSKEVKASPMPQTSPVSQTINKFNKSSSGTSLTGAISPKSTATSPADELAQKLNARRQAAESTSSTVQSGESKAASLLARASTNRPTQQTVSPAVNSSSASLNSSSVDNTSYLSVKSDEAPSPVKGPLSPTNGTLELEEKLTARRTVVDEQGTITTSDVVVAAMGDSFMNTTGGSVASAISSPAKAPPSDGLELSEKLTARRTVVDEQGTIIESVPAPHVVDVPVIKPQRPARPVIATGKNNIKPIVVPASVRPHASFDSPRALAEISTSESDSVMYHSTVDVDRTSSPEDIPRPLSALSPKSRFSQGVERSSSFKSVSFAVSSIEEEEKARRRRAQAMKRSRELAINMPYVPNYFPDEPLSNDRSENRVWTLVFAYCMPMVLMTVFSILQATADERMFSQLPSLARLEAFPGTRTSPTEWAPTGIRTTSGVERLTTPVLKATRSARASENRDGYIWTAAGPRFEPSWASESQTLIQGSGLTLDDWGNLFVSPSFTSAPEDADVSLIALDAQTGERKWVWRNPIVTGFFSSTPLEPPIVRAGAGTPLVLNDPTAAPEQRRVPQIVYHSTRTKAHALRSSDGSNVWSVLTGVPESEDFESNRVWGLTYVGRIDALVGLTSDGWIFLLDRATGNALAEIKKLPCAFPSPDAVPDSPPAGWDAFKQAFPAEEVTTGSAGVRCVLSPFATSPGGSDARLFVTATAKDEQDGYEDGFASTAALYSVEIVPGEADSKFPMRVRVAQSAPMGVRITDVGAPSVSVKGEWVVVGDASIQGVRILHSSNLSIIHEVVGLFQDQNGGVPSVALAEDEGSGSIYVKADREVVKLALQTGESEEGSAAAPEVVWTQSFSDITTVPFGLELRPASGPVMVGNGLALALHVTSSDYPYPSLSGLPIASGVVFLDRNSGGIRSYVIHPTAGEAIGDISIGMDGSVFAVHNPIARAQAVDTFARYSAPLVPLSGGLSRFKPLNYLELARDASCAALKRIDNTLQYQGGWLSSPPPGGEDAAKEDAKHVSALAWQAVVAFQIFGASSGAAKSLPNHGVLQSNIDTLAETVSNGAPLPVGFAPSAAFALLGAVRPSVEAICQEISAL